MVLEGDLYDSPVATALCERLPMTVSMSRWGEEYYGSIGGSIGGGLGVPPDSAELRDVMEFGELAYWANHPGPARWSWPSPRPSRPG